MEQNKSNCTKKIPANAQDPRPSPVSLPQKSIFFSSTLEYNIVYFFDFVGF